MTNLFVAPHKLKNAAVCFIDLGKLNLLIFLLPWSKSVKHTVGQIFDIFLLKFVTSGIQFFENYKEDRI
jgi:hypothetical protein